MEEYYDGAGVLVESFVLGDCHVADAPRNDVLDFAPHNDLEGGVLRNDGRNAISHTIWIYSSLRGAYTGMFLRGVQGHRVHTFAVQLSD